MQTHKTFSKENQLRDQRKPMHYQQHLTRTQKNSLISETLTIIMNRNSQYQNTCHIFVSYNHKAEVIRHYDEQPIMLFMQYLLLTTHHGTLFFH